ncbi:MAG TPA: hypothetical protein VMV15_02260 [Candidatus Binataceae bacterium]|nr:hypothetical protein [Candidatus Binataceae bacterium]
MSTPFDTVIEQIEVRGYHNQRLEDHSDVVSRGILNDLRSRCLPFAQDYETGKITSWENVRTPGARNRKIDLLVGEPLPDGQPDLEKLRLCIENKSVITAHRNLYARFDDLNEALQVLHRAKSEAVLVATVIVGVADRFLNVPDRVKPLYQGKPGAFAKLVRRLSSGDQSLWEKFPSAISANRPDDSNKTVARFRQLPTRSPGHTHVVGYDYVLLVPAFVDNVNVPYIPQVNDRRSLGIDVEREYQAMLDVICKAYSARWHL